MTDEVLALGPYVGSFEQEVMMFRPYAKWISEKLNRYTIISSHFNRSFLYEGMCNKFLPVFRQLSRRETLQNGYTHEDVKQKDYVTLTKLMKDKISESLHISKKSVEAMSVPYIKCSPPISIYNRVYTRIPTTTIKNKCNLLFIPDNSISENISVKILDHLRSKMEVSVLGDMNCNLTDHNEILGEIDYLNTGYHKIITAISNSIGVITPCSHWTMICNLQNTPVFSWGNSVGQYREGGIYHLKNKKSKAVFHDSGILNNLMSQMDIFLDNL